MTTLRSLRHARGLTLREVGEYLHKKYPRRFGPICPSAVFRIEQRGTDSWAVLSALAELYEVPIAIVAAAASEKKNDYLSTSP